MADAGKTLRITQVRSLIGSPDGLRRTLRALGLRRMHQTVTQPDRPEVRGMVAKVAHLVEVAYDGDGEVVDLKPGQEPKGAGRPAAGASVSDAEVADLRAAEEEALAEPGSAPPADLVQQPPDLDATDPPDAPKAKRGPVEGEGEAETPPSSVSEQ